MSNVTGGTAPPAVTPTTPVPTQSTPQQPTTPPTPSSSSPSPTPPTTSSTPTPTTPSSSSTPPTTSSTPPPTTSSTPPPTTSSTPITSSTPPTTSSSSTPEPTTSLPPTTVVTETPSTTSTAVTTVIRTTTPLPSSSSPSATTSSTSTPTPNDQAGSGSGGLSQGSKVAIGVVVPIAAIAILAILGLFWWKKRRARQEAEEQRRKEVEDYAYNPNADPTIPAVGLAADNSYEMREDGGSGYRGWGSTTAAGSTGRKASTTMSGGMPGGAYSDVTSPTRVANSEARSGEPLLDGSSSPDGEILGAMGPSAANNRGGDVRRGPSNASSSYSAAGRSEGSDGGVYGNGGGGGAYYDQYAQNPYSDQRPQELPGQAVIRDNPARRNTRIENPAHYPQQSAGIAQNF
ncbi:Mucin-2 [Purpureocillium lilacinum]|nr:Mucin-2 [Purpureocillium lilacinum]